MRAWVSSGVALFVVGWLGGALAVLADTLPPASRVDPFVARPRVIVLTDIANEPDDQMSLVRFLVYSNQWDVEGLVATTSTWMKDRVRPDVILTVLDAYEQVQPNLLKHAPGFPTAAALRGLVVAGQPGYGMAAVGRGRTSPGAALIVKAALAADPRPLWVLAWGGTNTLAQALTDARLERQPKELEAIVAKLRVYTISDQDDAGRWLRREFPALHYVAMPSTQDGQEYAAATWTGISGDRFYKNAPGADFTTFTDEWVNENIRAKGPLGKLYPYPCCIHEGDTPSFLGLVDNGLASAMSPAFGGWGGRYVWRQPSGETRPFWTQGGDSYPGRDNSRDTVSVEGRAYTSDQATIWRWRRAFQNDFAARMDWTIKGTSEANHNPLVVVNGRPGTEPIVIDAEVGSAVTLDATGTHDPDGHGLSFDWSFYPEAGSGIPGQPVFAPRPRPASPPAGAPGAGGVPSAPAGGPREAPVRVLVENPRSLVAVVVPKVAGIAHVVLAVEDDGTPSLTSYRRVILKIKPAGPERAASLPADLTAEEDHKRLMGLLGIESVRRGADPRNPQAPNAPNYDEAKANPYPVLPDALVLKDGRKVTTAQAWWDERRAEIVEDFDREVYGRAPKQTPKVTWVVASEAKGTVAGRPVVTKKLVGRVDNSSAPAIAVAIDLTLTVPTDASGPVPVMLEFGFNFGRGRPPAPPGPTAPDGPTWQEQLISRGWGYAVLLPTSVQADNGAGLTRGIIGLANKGQPRQPDDWGALRAWAWGASRALDYFETDAAVDARQVGIEGLSRYGKAALVAMAYEPRFAIAFVASSGAGGAKLHRRDYGERVENIAGSGGYHWMAGNYIKYAGPLTAKDLPVDAHELIALCAPRPVFVSSGSFEVEGGWVDAKGMFMAVAAAGSVYRLLGKQDLGTTEFPAVETALVSGDIAFRQHKGGHTAGPNWPTFLSFADRYIRARAPSPRVALTFDDLPVHSSLPPGLSRSDVARSLLDALSTHRAPPTYGFVNAKGLDGAPDNAEVLRLWRAAGHLLGNHAYSHMDLHANTAEAFEQDALAGEATLRTYMKDADWHWFRYPYLREGETLEKRRAVATFLKDRGYRVAQVTLNFDDYAYNEPYARCVTKNDAVAIEGLKQSYLRRAKASIDAGQQAARLVYGRDIAHVMLLHIGGFETVMLPKLLELLEGKGFRLVSLQEAQADPIYAIDPDQALPNGATLLDQMRVAKAMPAEAPPDDTFATLAAVCR